ncbi:MAG: ABC transporter ATP-binding protein [Fibrobacterales bacterium]
MIEIKDLRKTWKQDLFKKPHEVLKGVTFSVHKGDLFGFIGPNGAGKSTTIKSLLGLIRYDSGIATLFGEKTFSKSVAQQVGYLPEHPYFYSYLTGRELLAFYAELHGIGLNDRNDRITEVAAELHIGDHWIDTPLKTYSKGMVQKIGIAQAILHKPSLLILDEPMSGLDPVARRLVRDLLVTLNQQGTTIFYSSHILHDVESVSNRIALLVDGTVRAAGTISDLIDKTTSRNSLEELLLQEVSSIGY